MTNYSVDRYDTIALAHAAIELLDTATVTFKIVYYRENCASKAMIIKPAPNKVAA